MSDNPEDQFDFWIGEWKCTWGKDSKALNRIEHILNDNVVQEKFNGGVFQCLSVLTWEVKWQIKYRRKI